MVTLEVLQTLEGLDCAAWNALTCPDFPFADFEHLRALEQTGCAGPDMGWYPLYLLLRNADGGLVAAAYLYIKSHGYGEFVFDHVWSQAYARLGLDYYPKLVSAVPYTPANGVKVLVHPDSDRLTLEKALAEEMKQVALRVGCSSVHVLFVPQQHLPQYEQSDYFLRCGVQFHWSNKGYTDFDGFLAQLKQKRRRQIALERRQLSQYPDLSIVTRTGSDLNEEDADLMARLYLDTNEKWGSIPCLSKDFFRQIFQTMSDRIVLFVATIAGEPVAAALNFKKGRKMYGRYWGTLRDIKHLHFELCYYQAIEYCINNKIDIYEAGAQGEHKIPRGFSPQMTFSLHHLIQPDLVGAARNFVRQERLALEEQMRTWQMHSAYKDESV